MFLNKHNAQSALVELYLSKSWKPKLPRVKRKKIFFFNGW
jgi:hypothetical protein